MQNYFDLQKLAAQRGVSKQEIFLKVYNFLNKNQHDHVDGFIEGKDLDQPFILQLTDCADENYDTSRSEAEIHVIEG